MARAQIKAAIKRATRRAQRQMNQFDAEQLRELRRIYQRGADEIRQEIAGRADGGGVLNIEVLDALRRQIEARLEALSKTRDELLDSGLERAAQLGTQPMEAAITGGELSRVADDAVRFVRRFVGEDGLQLSDRIWRLDRGARQAVTSAVENAVVQGWSASRAAREFTGRGEPVPDEIARKMRQGNAHRVGRLAADALVRDERSPYEMARRVFRTELNRAHGVAYREAALQDEDAVGTRFLLSPRHPRRDICDMHASVNRYGLGPGVYPPGKSPWPAHPNTLSYEEVVFDDEVTDDDRAGEEDRIAWLKRQPPGVQDLVLNSRRKRVALERGLLTENQIATPWRELKERLSRQGIDPETLRPEA